MLKYIQTLTCVAILACSLFSCQNQNSDVRTAAREDVENQAVQPADAAKQQVQTATQAAVPAGPTTTMTFAETEFSFGSVNEGELVAHTYNFTNTGENPLILSDAKGSCGCTVPQWPREPIAPGESGVVTVEFNSKNKAGKRSQKVTITANTNPPQTFIHLNGEVIKTETATQ